MAKAGKSTASNSGGLRVPLKIQIAGLLAFFVAVLGFISISSTIDYLEQNKTAQVREIQNLQVTRQISELTTLWERAKTTLTDQAFRLIDAGRGAPVLATGWKWIRVGDKIFQNPDSKESVTTFPGPPERREFFIAPTPDAKAFYLFLPINIKQGATEKTEWAMAEVARSIVLGKENSLRSAIQEVLIDVASLKGGYSQADIARSAWQGAPESIKAFATLFTLVPGEDRKAILDVTPRPVSREITLQNKAGYIVSWASIPSQNADQQLTLITFVDREGLLRSFRTFVVKQTFFAFLILGAGFLFALFIARRLSSPVEQLVKAAKILETGDFKVRVDIHRRDEIGDLAGAFNHMGEALDERETALQAAQNTIIQNEKLAAIGTLSAGIAHEVKNPLAGILGNADLVASQIKKLNVPNVGPLLNYIEVIQKETKRCRGIIDSLMRFSRQEKSTFAALDLEVVAWETIQLLEHSLNMAKVTVVKNFSDDLKMIDGNANQIEQTLLNMMQNSGHAMPQGGTITLATQYYPHPAQAPLGRFIALKSAEFQGPFCRISISDTGTGMTDEILRKIFEPFFTTKPKGLGTGLGLAVTLGILADHKSRISVDSAPGKGTTFYMDFMATGDRTPNILRELDEIKKKAGGGASLASDVGAKKVVAPGSRPGDLPSFPVDERANERSQSQSLRPPPPKSRGQTSIRGNAGTSMKDLGIKSPEIEISQMPDIASGLGLTSMEPPAGAPDPLASNFSLPRSPDSSPGWPAGEGSKRFQIKKPKAKNSETKK